MSHRAGRGVRLFIRVLVVGAVVSGCGLARVEDRDPVEIPDGPLEAVGAEAIGPVVELGRGRSLGTGWRYAIFESADGWCTQLEMASFASTGCGDPAAQDGHAFAGIGSGSAGDGAVSFEGIVGPEVAEVWLTTPSGQRIETRLMSLDDAGLEGSAFVGFAPPDAGVAAAVALDADGRELETYDLP
jgi:hypothetical protein